MFVNVSLENWKYRQDSGIGIAIHKYMEVLEDGRFVVPALYSLGKRWSGYESRGL